MKSKKNRRVVRLGKASRKKVLLLLRKARVRKRLARKARKGVNGKTIRYGRGKKNTLLRKKRRIRRRTVRKVKVIHPPVSVVPAADPPPAAEVVALPPDLGVPPEMQPADAFQQGYTEAYNVGFDAGFAKGFEDGHKLEFG